MDLLEKKESYFSSCSYHAPAFIDISEESGITKEAIERGLDAMCEMAEIYPLGGAADRLHLVDENTQMELPAAKLCFGGKTLFERLIRDLQAREYLYLPNLRQTICDSNRDNNIFGKR